VVGRNAGPSQGQIGMERDARRAADSGRCGFQGMEMEQAAGDGIEHAAWGDEIEQAVRRWMLMKWN
jgi:hypothetical protein